MEVLAFGLMSLAIFALAIAFAVAMPDDAMRVGRRRFRGVWIVIAIVTGLVGYANILMGIATIDALGREDIRDRGQSTFHAGPLNESRVVAGARPLIRSEPERRK